MAVLNTVDRYHLADEVINQLPAFHLRGADTRKYLHQKLLEQKSYIHTYGQDMPEILNCKWKDVSILKR